MKTSGILWQYYWDERTLDGNDNIIDFPNNNSNNSNNTKYKDNNNNNNNLFKFKQQITVQTGNVWTKDVEIMVPLEYLNDFCKTLEMFITNSKLLFS